VLVDLYCASSAKPPASVTLDIDDTCDVVHGQPQLSLFNAHHDDRCFLPIHVYDTATSRPVAVILRPGKTPSGREVRSHLRRLIRAIRRHWPTTAITIRGDGHYGRPEVMVRSRGQRRGLRLRADRHQGAGGRGRGDGRSHPGGAGRRRHGCGARLCRDHACGQVLAVSWRQQRRVAARIEATRLGLDIRDRVTNIMTGTPEWLYAELYCARGQAENLIKLHKSQLASDRTSCRHPAANQMRLVLHTAAYWLMLTVRDAIPKAHHLARAEFATIRLRLLKLGARIRESAARVRLAFAAACPEADLLRHLAGALGPAPA
jgi:hypothetical protein